MSFISSSSSYGDVLSKRRWLKSPTNSALVHPLQAVDTPSSSVKRLFPSLSMFNLPSSMVLSPTATLCETSSITTDASFSHKLQSPASSTNTSQLMRPPSKTQQDPLEIVRLLLDRLTAWQILITRLLHHTQRLAITEGVVAKTYRRCFDATHLLATHPLLDAHFDPSSKGSGVRQVCKDWHQQHLDRIQQHTELLQTLKQDAIPTLQKMKRDLKLMMQSIRADDRLKPHVLTKLKREAEQRLNQLDHQLRLFDDHPCESHTKQDPWLMNAGVVKQMIKVHYHQNKIHETVLRLQHETQVLERQCLDQCRRLCQPTDNIRHNDDWDDFESRHVLLTPTFRNPELLEYHHPLLEPVLASRMERKTLWGWREHMYVLTPAGFLHEYQTQASYPAKPAQSVFVAHHSLWVGPARLHQSLVFGLTGKWLLRAKSVVELDAWVDQLTKCADRYYGLRQAKEEGSDRVQEEVVEEGVKKDVDEMTQKEEQVVVEQVKIEEPMNNEEAVKEEPVKEELAKEEEGEAETTV
ncbi:MAG: hypothetical protein EXX96DRAFT_614001 [Benjaminiella poitrasii]|nr:MAG: hypothetical protein EXX96DRAFT_614001 [Benjaminiella poitrasii]